MVGVLQPADPRLIGPYQLLGRLGAGGMGRVFLGMSAAGRPVAVKIVHAELAADPEFRARFSSEVAAARKVSGLFTALVVDADVDAPVPWLATAYVAGPSLSEAVQEPRAADRRVAAGAGRGPGQEPDRDPRGGRRARRPQAVQRAAGPGRAARDRLRDLPGRGGGSAGAGRPRGRHAQLHVPRAGRGRGGRAAQRRVQPGRGARLRRHRAQAVRHRAARRGARAGGPRGGRPQGRSRRGAAADRTVPGQGPGRAAHRRRAAGRGDRRPVRDGAAARAGLRGRAGADPPPGPGPAAARRRRRGGR